MNTSAMNTQTENATTPALNESTLHATLKDALKQGGAWYVYLFADGSTASLNPWSDSTLIENCGGGRLFAAELSNLTPEDEAAARASAEVAAEIADNLIDNHGLIEAANELLEGMNEEAAEDAATAVVDVPATVNA